MALGGLPMEMLGEAGFDSSSFDLDELSKISGLEPLVLALRAPDQAPPQGLIQLLAMMNQHLLNQRLTELSAACNFLEQGAAFQHLFDQIFTADQFGPIRRALGTLQGLLIALLNSLESANVDDFADDPPTMEQEMPGPPARLTSSLRTLRTHAQLLLRSLWASDSTPEYSLRDGIEAMVTELSDLSAGLPALERGGLALTEAEKRFLPELRNRIHDFQSDLSVLLKDPELRSLLESPLHGEYSEAFSRAIPWITQFTQERFAPAGGPAHRLH